MPNEKCHCALPTKKRAPVLLAMRGGEDGGKYPLVKADKAEKKDKQVMPKPISPANDVISLQDVTKKPINRITHAAHEVEASKSIDVHTGATMAPSGKVHKSKFKILMLVYLV